MKNEQHVHRYQGLPSGAGKIVCSCGYETPAVDSSNAFTLGTKVKTVEQYFAEHIEAVRGEGAVETSMVAPAKEAAVAPAQKPHVRKGKR